MTRETTTSRGLGWSHQKRRAALLRNLVDGTPCAECGLPMFRSQPLDADHSVPRSQGGTQADRLLHMSCNRARGDGTHQKRPTFMPVTTSRDW